MSNSDQQNMSSRSGPAPAPNGPWLVHTRRSADNPAYNGERLGSSNVDASRILQRFRSRRPTPNRIISDSIIPNPMPNIPPPPSPVAVNDHPQLSTSVFPLSLQPRNTPPPPIPPMPYLDSDIFRDYSLNSPQDYFLHETRLYQRINYQAKTRLGYAKAISVLHMELEKSSEYEATILPYQIDRPDNLPSLRHLISNSGARLFADTVRALVAIIGLQRACHLLENAEIEEIPGIRYEIQRVPIPSPPPPIPLEPINVPSPMVPAEIGPFARLRSQVPPPPGPSRTTYSWNQSRPSIIMPAQSPPSTYEEGDNHHLNLPQSPLSHRPKRPANANNETELERDLTNCFGNVVGTVYPRGVLRRNVGRGGKLKCSHCRASKRAVEPLVQSNYFAD